MSQLENKKEEYHVVRFGTGFKYHVQECQDFSGMVLCGKTGNPEFIRCSRLDSPRVQKDIEQYPHTKCQKCFQKLEELLK